MKNKKRVFVFLFVCTFLMLGHRLYAQETDEIQERVKKAESAGLLDWIDEEGYLIDRYFSGKSDAELSELSIDGLVRTMSEEEVDAYVSNLNQGISLYTVTYYQKVSQVNPDTGRMLYTGLFEVDGVLAYCIQRSVSTPPKGSSTGSPVAVTNENLRKVLYYGYNGPKAKGYTYVETAVAAGEANGDGDNSLGRKVLAEIKTMAAPPSSFKVWKVSTNGGKTQDLAYYTVVEENGKGQIQKASKYEDMSKNNENYSLQGAVFGIYSDAACQAKLKEVTTKENGMSDTFELSSGTYYIKEIKAPQGFEINSTIKSIKINPSQTTLVVMENIPETIKPDILLQKVDAETGKAVPQGSGTLHGAQFLVKFFGGNYGKDENPETKGVTPKKQWTLQTDASGKILFQDSYLVNGDSFWKNDAGEVVLPFGTLTIQEIQSSNGYRVNEEVFQVVIEAKTDTLPEILVEEEPIQVKAIKYQEGTQEVLQGAVFEHTAPDGTIEQLETGPNGILVWKGLQRGKHEIKEVSAPVGYYLNENVIVFEVTEKNEIQVLSEVNEVYGKILCTIDEAGNLVLEVEDKVGFRLPETGGCGSVWICCTGVLICSKGLYKRRRPTMNSQ